MHITTLAEKAMLVRLTRSMYQPYAYDEQASVEIDALHGTTRAGRFNKRLFKGDTQLKACNQAFTEVYEYHMRHTVPWLDDGMRMLPSAGYLEYTADMRQLIAEADRRADALETQWAQLVAEDIRRLGSLGNAADYPLSVREKYKISLKFLPVPTTEDFRVAISPEDRASLDRAIEEAKAGVSKHLLSEMLGPVKAFVEKLAVPIGETGSVFRDSLVDNVMDLVWRLPKLNLTGDPLVSALITEIETVVSGYALQPDVLREDPVSRATAQAQMADVMAKMATFMGV